MERVYSYNPGAHTGQEELTELAESRGVELLMIRTMITMITTMVILMFFHHIERARFRLVLRKVTDYQCNADTTTELRMKLREFSQIYTVSEKNCAFLFLLELSQISTNFNKFW